MNLVHMFQSVLYVAYRIHKQSPWVRNRRFTDLLYHLRAETDELLAAEDFDHQLEELGDVLFAVVRTLFKLDDDQIEQVFTGVLDKMVFRYPSVFEGLSGSTEEEVHRHFMERKALAKQHPEKQKGAAQRARIYGYPPDRTILAQRVGEVVVTSQLA